MEPLYSKNDGEWIPNKHTLGPYPGSQHGGAVAGVLAHEIEAHAAALDAGQAMTFSVCQLRPAPISPAEITTETIRDGRRSTFVQAEIFFEGKATARATAVFAKPVDVPHLPDLPKEQFDPTGMEIVRLQMGFPEVSYMSCLEIRKGGDGFLWLRLNRPAVAGQSALVGLMALADMSPGVSMIVSDTPWQDLFQAFPSLDLTVHLLRSPMGEWVGFDSRSTYSNRGLGLTESALYDSQGPLGRIAQSFVIVPN